MRIFFSVFVVCSISLVQAQNEAVNWYFGNAALNFSIFPPADLGNNGLGAMEGCASISDANGNLLMYTNGAEVWNKSHQQMSNGNNLGGHFTSTQSSLIVKKPGASHQYFIFTTHGSTVAPLAYSIVDVSLAAGLGSVTAKNVTVTAPVAEKLAAAYHCNGQDVWIVAHKQNSSEFCSYLLTSAGLSTVAVVSSVGSTHAGLQGSAGQMKISPSGNKLAVAISLPGAFEMFDFDVLTGVVSNPESLGSYQVAYGCEFSPDGSKLYGTYLISQNPVKGGIVQWDLCAGSPQAVAASVTVVDTTVGSQLNSLQLGHFGKVYFAENTQPFMGRIDSPGIPGLACGSQNASISFTSSICRSGLPNFIGSWFRQKPAASASVTACSSVAFSYAAACKVSGAAPDSVAWLFDDPGSGSANISGLANPFHMYPARNGTYNVRLLAYFPCYTDTVPVPVHISAFPTLSVSGRSSICKNGTVTLTAGGAATYSWSTGQQTPTLQLSPVGTAVYTLTGASAAGCNASIPFTVTVDPCAGWSEENILQTAVFPNPVEGQLTISSSFAGEAILTDACGRTLAEITIAMGENHLMMASFEAGLYFICIQSQVQASRSVFRIIKQ